MATNHTFSVLSIVRKSRSKRQMVPIYLRITVNGKRSEISTKEYVDMSKWNSTKGKAKGNSEKARQINSRLDTWETKVHEYYSQFIRDGKTISAPLLKDAVLGRLDKKNLLLPYFDHHEKEIKSKIGIDYAKGTHQNYVATSRHLENYLDKKFKGLVISLKDVDYDFITGFEPIIKKGRELHDQGKYRGAAEILNKLVYAEPDNQDAKDLLADVYEQIGYQQENPGLRNSFLNGAYELRSGMPVEEDKLNTLSPDLARAMTTGLFFEYVGIMLDSRKAEGMEFTINLITPDNGEKYIIELSNATLTNIEGFQAKDADLTLTITRLGLALVMTGKKSLQDQIADGEAKAEGDVGVLKQLASTLVHFTPDFEILPGTKAADVSDQDVNDFEVGEVATIHE